MGVHIELPPRRVVLGLDPGKTGCAVLLDVDRPTYSMEYRFDKFTDAEWLDLLVATGKDYRVVLALMERISPQPVPSPRKCIGCGKVSMAVSMPGASSMFKMGDAYAVMRLATMAAGIPLELITPSDWMKAMGVKGKKKDASGIRDKAQQLLPHAKPRPTQQTGDAYLLAWLARSRVQGAEV